MPPDLLLIVCDTARADAFEPWGAPYPTPTLARLCREGTWFADALTTAPWTVPSHASMFTGRLPTEHGITGECFEWHDRKPTSPATAVAAYPGTWLPEELRARGYRTWGASCNSWVSRWGGFDRGFDDFLDLRPWARKRTRTGRLAYRASKALGRTDRGGREAVERFGERLASAGSEPLFAFVNLMETHAPLNAPRPFYPFAPWRRRTTNRMAGGPDQGLSYNAGVLRPGRDYVRILRELYAGCARYEDRVLSGLLRAVADRGRETVVVLVADHGEHLGEHGLFNHNSSLGEPLVHVPLVAWGQRLDLAGGRVDGPLSVTALASWLGEATDGVVDPPTPEGPVVSEYEGTAQHNGVPEETLAGIERLGGRSAVPTLIFQPGLAVRKGNLKYVAAANGEEWLYDVSVDPGEDHDVLPGRTDAAARYFHPHREAWERRRAERPEYAAGEVAEGEIADHLRTLGYIE
jgi:arylsulfatase A-like enzyme